MQDTVRYSRLEMGTNQISITLTDTERENLDSQARQSVLSMSAFARQTLVQSLDLATEKKKKNQPKS